MPRPKHRTSPSQRRSRRVKGWLPAGTQPQSARAQKDGAANRWGSQQACRYARERAALNLNLTVDAYRSVAHAKATGEWIE